MYLSVLTYLLRVCPAASVMQRLHGDIMTVYISVFRPGRQRRQRTGIVWRVDTMRCRCESGYNEACCPESRCNVVPRFVHRDSRNTADIACNLQTVIHND